LRRRRQALRWATGGAALLVAVLWILAGVFALDFLFSLQTLQRAVVMAVGAGLLVWAFLKFTRPYWGVSESLIDVALLVEKRQGIDSDLVAALQFESPQADRWGSRELEDAVIDYVAELDRGLDVFAGFTAETFWRRSGVLAVTLAIAVVLGVLYPAHLATFLARLG
ncbi:MAG: hypothetical protein KDA42_20345, partial [Planctomycetales bacterium]|nr:hypothetical protein [Planctomycetales bacterium]